MAVKLVMRQSPRELRRFAHEIGILKSLRHTNIVQVTPALDQITPWPISSATFCSKLFWSHLWLPSVNSSSASVAYSANNQSPVLQANGAVVTAPTR